MRNRGRCYSDKVFRNRCNDQVDLIHRLRPTKKLTVTFSPKTLFSSLRSPFKLVKSLSLVEGWECMAYGSIHPFSEPRWEGCFTSLNTRRPVYLKFELEEEISDLCAKLNNAAASRWHSLLLCSRSHGWGYRNCERKVQSEPWNSKPMGEDRQQMGNRTLDWEYLVGNLPWPLSSDAMENQWVLSYLLVFYKWFHRGIGNTSAAM